MTSPTDPNFEPRYRGRWNPLAWLEAFHLLTAMRSEAAKAVADPDGLTAGHDPTDLHIQAYSGPGCGWCCVVLYWWGIPYGTSCSYVCNSGH